MTSWLPPRGIYEITAERDRIFIPRSPIIRRVSRSDWPRGGARAIEGTTRLDATRRLLPCLVLRGGIRVYRVTRHQINACRIAAFLRVHQAFIPSLLPLFGFSAFRVRAKFFCFEQYIDAGKNLASRKFNNFFTSDFHKNTHIFLLKSFNRVYRWK